MNEIITFLLDQWLLSGMLFVLIVLFIYSEKPKKYKIIDNNAAITLMDNGNLIIIDVREEKERNTGFINSAEHITMSNIKDKMDAINKNKNILTYCKNGLRSKTAAEILCKNKFENVHNLKGGFEAWKEAGLPITK